MPVITTSRLQLRQLTMDDVESLSGIFLDPEAMLFYPSTRNLEETKASIQNNLANYMNWGQGFWAVQFRDTGEFAGQCGLIYQMVEEVRELEIAYLFLRKYWNQGLATEAATACRDYAFDTLGAKRVVSLIDPGNVASRRVAEKVGMHLTNEIIKWNKPVLVYAMEVFDR